MRSLVLAFFLIVCCVSAQASTGLDAFLEQARQRAAEEQRKDLERELEFMADLDAARERTQEARALVRGERDRQERLLAKYDANEAVLAELEAVLREQQGGLGEMFGVVRQSAGDFHAQFLGSLAMADKPEALDFLHALGNSRGLPGMEELERFWLILLEEMVGSSRTDRFMSEVVLPDGSARQREVLRVGPFSAVSEGAYLSHVQGRNQFLELPRQPQGRYLRLARDLEQALPGQTTFFALDPSRGAILTHLVQSPTLTERIKQGREIGMIILVLGLVGVIVFVVRFTMLTVIGRRIRRQLRSLQGLPDNPLGRIMLLAQANSLSDSETLEIRLDEAVLKEVPRLERGLTTIKILAAVAPLLGLLGTVVGMIETFQAITLFGTGDPQLMAGGISQALVTTALGLSIAIPLLLLHSVAAAKSRQLTTIMEEQGAGLLAEHIQRMREK
ncbi:MotA/TolQ/ExbB proton channel family protein [Desulfonatronum sp. SC1]|uniref:MotA/TolQ/ExbB proton channel family protein n=1 Tax=Desulfonatronum sp. SC1 TaxID=2109626 RepID=UPI000D3134F6|nr:MotA/TolQ/ExbB proton channel family protein [Desulfonatronum sp. SC1]PTN38781.1 flagellar motor protein MotA [Desulfonatronum sp. SC1]